MSGQPVGEKDAAHQVVVTHGEVTVGLERDAHLVTLLHQSPDGTAHRDDGIVRIRAEDEHPLGVGFFALGAIGVISVGFATGPTCDGVL